MGFFDFLKPGSSEDQIKEYLGKGAVVLDVRTLGEYQEGHVKGSKHIVLTTVPLNVDEIKSWGKPVIAVCKSGGRSGQATQFLSNHGVDVLNGGPWQNVASVLEQ